MSHPMFDRITRRMEVLQREIDKKHKSGGNAPVRAPRVNPVAPRGIFTQCDGKPKPNPQEFHCT